MTTFGPQNAQETALTDVLLDNVMQVLPSQSVR